eukprot:10366721-Ditylum_brightwellii.AAC.1
MSEESEDDQSIGVHNEVSVLVKPDKVTVAEEVEKGDQTSTLNNECRENNEEDGELENTPIGRITKAFKDAVENLERELRKTRKADACQPT